MKKGNGLKKILVGLVSVIAVSSMANYAFNDYQNNIILSECIESKKAALDEVYTGISNDYEGIKSPVLRNDLDRAYNRKLEELRAFLVSSKETQLIECKR
ncbi:hypothetical protein [Vibrio parahaemolyticus]|uniref:hypothetical protein n=1 Tax=Vibrio parahaemolyticus TaxID=670 RepID=UPI000C273359|nr:hypothetical protein [Vibrio parahaemolyticus]MDF5052689.1 hypothetical protein [Vibrio parahaemolyticus]PJN44105.1 hypothetical protein CNR26_20230 [Vibrio parahaemolyticus]